MSIIDDYLKRIEDAVQREILAALAAILRRLLPEAEEGISYGLPALKIKGKAVAGLAASAGGGSYYPFSGGVTALSA
jgi:uncharacterized protein YdhG (YjbR/CyaY superfamily)